MKIKTIVKTCVEFNGREAEQLFNFIQAALNGYGIDPDSRTVAIQFGQALERNAPAKPPF